jgi:hypothetical protein
MHNDDEPVSQAFPWIQTACLCAALSAAIHRQQRARMGRDTFRCALGLHGDKSMLLCVWQTLASSRPCTPSRPYLRCLLGGEAAPQPPAVAEHDGGAEHRAGMANLGRKTLHFSHR